MNERKKERKIARGWGERKVSWKTFFPKNSES